MSLAGLGQGFAAAVSQYPQLLLAKRQMEQGDRRLGMLEEQHKLQMAAAQRQEDQAGDAQFVARMYPLLKAGDYGTATRYAMQDPDRTNRLLGLGEGRAFAGFQGVSGPGGEEYITALVNNSKTGSTGPMTERASADPDDNVVYLPTSSLDAVFSPYLPAAKPVDYYDVVETPDGRLVQAPKTGRGGLRELGTFETPPEAPEPPPEIVFRNVDGVLYAGDPRTGETWRASKKDVRKQVDDVLDRRLPASDFEADPAKRTRLVSQAAGVAMSLLSRDIDPTMALPWVIDGIMANQDLFLGEDREAAKEAQRELANRVSQRFEVEPSMPQGTPTPPAAGALGQLGTANATPPMPNLGVDSTVPANTPAQVVRNVRAAADRMLANADLPPEMKTQIVTLLDAGRYDEASRLLASAGPAGARVTAVLAALAKAAAGG